MKRLSAGKIELDLEHPVIMGVLNVTPDSFSDGGQHSTIQSAVSRAIEMHQQGAHIIDVGGQSTRPGAVEISLQEELDRVIPVIEKLRGSDSLVISVDTNKPDVMQAAVDAGAHMINDISALTIPGALEVAARCAVPVCLMHMQGTPRDMQDSPEYANVVEEVKAFLVNRIDQCHKAGIQKERLIVDPGFGFGKTLEHNLCLMKHLDELTVMGVPVLVGVSRKSMIGAVLGRNVDERLSGSVGLACMAYLKGAKILRVHDVQETVDALRMIDAVQYSD